MSDPKHVCPDPAQGLSEGPPVTAPPQYAAPPPWREPGFLVEGYTDYVRALSSDSFEEFNACHLLEMNQQGVISECRKNSRNDQEIFELVGLYFEKSLPIVFVDFGKCMKRARDSQSLVHVAFQQHEEESEAGSNTFVKTLEKLKNFKAAGAPFTEEFFQIFQPFKKQQRLMLEKLQLKKNKLDKQLKRIRAWRKVSRFIFATTFGAVLICSVVAAAMAAPPVAAALAAATSIPLGSMGKWIDSLWKNYENAVKAQKELISTMETGTSVAIKDFDSIRVLIDRLQIEIEALMQNAEFAIEHDALKLTIPEIKKRLKVFMNIVEDLGAQADRCSRDILRARTAVLQTIIKHSNN